MSEMIGDWIARAALVATGYVWGTRGWLDALLFFLIFLGACFALYGMTQWPWMERRR